MNDPTDGAQPVTNTAPDSPNTATTAAPTSASTPAPDAQQQPATASPATPTPAQPQPAQQPSAAPHPLAAYQYLSPDGQHGWNGQQWVPIPGGGGTASNAPTVHPTVAKAGILHQVATALAGGDTYKTTIDPNTGQATRTPVPLSGRQIGMAIVLEALSGGLAGLSARGPNAVGEAAGLGLQQGQQIAQQRQQQQAQQDQTAQQDYKNQTSALAAKAAAFEANSRQILNQAQSSRYGVESLKDAVSSNADLLKSYQDADAVQESHVSEDAISAGIKSGAYDPTKQIAIPDGFTNLNGRYESTYSLVANPRAKVPLSQEQAQAFGDAGIPGWAAYKGGKTKVPAGYQVPGTMIATANAQVQAIGLMKQDVSQVTDALSNSSDKANQELAKSIPNISALLSDPNNGPPLQSSLLKYQKYVSHQFMHGMDLYESLQQMASPSKANPQNPKQAISNPDAPFAQTIAGAFGNGDPQQGWAVLRAYHDEVAPTNIKSLNDAQNILSNPDSTSKEMGQAHEFLALDRQQKAGTAGAEERSRQAAKPQPSPASLTTPDALGFTPTVSDAKEANKRFGTFKKNLDDLSRSEQSYAQFQQALGDIDAGNWTGADSVVALFNAIGLSAAPLAGRGFRINQNTISEHEHARGWEGALQAKLQGVQTGAVITPQQLKDYAGIAAQSRSNQIIATANEMHGAGISADAALPVGNGQKITPDTASIFLRLAGNDPNKARAAAAKKGWTF